VALVLTAALCPARAQEPVVSAVRAPYLNFESGPVNALLLSPDGRHLYALNTPDHRVEVYRTALDPSPGAGLPSAGGVAAGVGGPGAPVPGGHGVGLSPGLGAAVVLRHEASIFTGLEPVAMALDPADPQRLFVSNHLSDTVSVVDLAIGRVQATIEVGDEPQGLALAGGRLFVACARAPVSASTPGQVVPAAHVDHTVVVFDAVPPHDRLASLPIGNVKPRDVLAVDGTMFVIPQHSGNHTTILDETAAKTLGLEQEVPDAFDPPFTVNPVLLRPEFDSLPWTRGWFIPNAARIVFDSEHPGLVPQLLDRDVVAIDVDTLTLLPGATGGVATTLLDIERNPATGALWVVGTEALNRTRFEPNLRGAALENRVVVVAPGGAVQQTVVLEPPVTASEHSQPAVLAFGDGPDGPLAFVGCLGTASVVVLDAASAQVVAEIETGEIPSGLAVDGARGVLYVLSRGDHALRRYDLRGGFAALGSPVPLPYDPEPLAVRQGRTHLYDARQETGHGDRNLSCAGCHVFGHLDQLAWDLGDPGGSLGYYYPDVLAIGARRTCSGGPSKGCWAARASPGGRCRSSRPSCAACATRPTRCSRRIASTWAWRAAATTCTA
jgi:YVTN family beta-propeller protein